METKRKFALFVAVCRQPVLAVLVSAVLLPAPPANAQIWVWKDANDRTVSSDQPPPPNIPLKNIIRAPRPVNTARGAPEGAARTDSPGSSTSAEVDRKIEGPKTTADKDLEFRKRQREAADATKKQEEEATRARQRADRCKGLRGNLAGLESGVRIARVNEKGEREYLDDAQRQAEIGKTRAAAADC